MMSYIYLNTKTKTMTKFTIKKADTLIKYLKKGKISFELDPMNSDKVIVNIKENYNGDALFWFGVDYGMYANNNNNNNNYK